MDIIRNHSLLYFKEQMYVQVWAHVAEPLARDLFLHYVKVLAHSGYGFVAFGLSSVYSQFEEKMAARQLTLLSILLICAMFSVEIVFAMMIIRNGIVPHQEGVFFYTRFLLPVMLFAWFISSQRLGWPRVFSRLARYGYGVYLVHPVMIDVYEIVMDPRELSPSIYVAGKFVFALAATFALVLALARTRSLAWTIGLGPSPWRDTTPVAHQRW